MDCLDLYPIYFLQSWGGLDHSRIDETRKSWETVRLTSSLLLRRLRVLGRTCSKWLVYFIKRYICTYVELTIYAVVYSLLEVNEQQFELKKIVDHVYCMCSGYRWKTTCWPLLQNWTCRPMGHELPWFTILHLIWELMSCLVWTTASPVWTVLCKESAVWTTSGCRRKLSILHCK